MPSQGPGASADPGRVRAVPRVRRRAAGRDVRTGAAGRREFLPGGRVEGGSAERRALERHVDGDGGGVRAGRAARGSLLLRDEQRVVAAGALRHADAGQHDGVRARDRRHDDRGHRRRSAPVARAAAVRGDREGRGPGGAGDRLQPRPGSAAGQYTFGPLDGGEPFYSDGGVGLLPDPRTSPAACAGWTSWCGTCTSRSASICRLRCAWRR